MKKKIAAEKIWRAGAVSAFRMAGDAARSVRSYAFRALLALMLVPAFMLSLACCTPSPPVEVPDPQTVPPQETAAHDTDAPSPAPSSVPGTAMPTADGTAAPSAAPTASPLPAPSSTPNDGAEKLLAKYLGIHGYGSVNADPKVYRFLKDGNETLFAIRSDSDFSIQNRLYEGYEYELTIENGIIVNAVLSGELGEDSPSPVSYTPGKRTLKNLLAAAMQPVGSTLYVYGGGWNWQDDGASYLSRMIGRPRTWRDFFLTNDASYVYKDEASPEKSYYPFGGWCEYFYAGLDCSGYLGWTLYNTLETESGHAGYVFKSTDFAKTLADMGFGTYGADKLEVGGAPLQSGDIVSFKGHTYLVLGRCDDGSLVILHSSPTPSRTGNKGGGVQLSALDPNGGGGMALELIKRYTERYYPEWYARYENIAVSYSTYIDFERSGNAGFFRWSIGDSLADPDGILNMNAEEILKTLFAEA